MDKNEFSQCVDLLLHCVHSDNLIGPDNALLQYCGLQILHKAASGDLSPQDFNTACWFLRGRIAEPAIRLIQSDPIHSPERPPAGIRSVRCVPNNTSLNSSSTLVKQAQDSFPYSLQQSETQLGSIARVRADTRITYDEIWHLVCRKPGHPKIRLLAPCLVELASYGRVTTIHVPVFGRESEAEQWVHALASWLGCRENIQLAGTFMDLHFTHKSERLATRIGGLLGDAGVPHGWIGES